MNDWNNKNIPAASVKIETFFQKEEIYNVRHK